MQAFKIVNMDTEQKWACDGISEKQGSEGKSLKETEPETSNSNAESKEKISAPKPPKVRPSG